MCVKKEFKASTFQSVPWKIPRQIALRFMRIIKKAIFSLKDFFFDILHAPCLKKLIIIGVGEISILLWMASIKPCISKTLKLGKLLLRFTADLESKIARFVR